MNQWPTQLEGQDPQWPPQQQAQQPQWPFQTQVPQPQWSQPQQPQFQPAPQPQVSSPQWSQQQWLQQPEAQPFSPPVQQPKRQFQPPLPPQVSQPEWSQQLQGQQFTIPTPQPQVPTSQPAYWPEWTPDIAAQVPQAELTAKNDTRKRQASRTRLLLTLIATGLILLGIVAGAISHYFISPTSTALSFEKARLHGDNATVFSLTCPANRQASQAPANIRIQPQIDDSKLGASVANVSFNQVTASVTGPLVINNGPTWGSSTILVRQSLDLQADGTGWCVARYY